MSKATAALMFLLAAALARGNTYTVTNTNDSGAGSLRKAIDDANANPGADTIAFNIPGAGVHTITPLTDLPQITDSVTIDGYTQPGSSVNTDPIATNAVLLIELDGSTQPFSDRGLWIADTAGGTTIRGLVINRWDIGIQLSGPGSHVTGNFIGTDPAGNPGGYNAWGIWFDGTDLATVIGGTAPADRNLISGNGDGIAVLSGRLTIQGNLIGTDRTGTHPGGIFSHTGTGVYLSATTSPGSIVGGTAAGAGNVISGNSIGVSIYFDSVANVVQGNRIGTNAAGTGPLGNDIGIAVAGSDNIIGGISAGEANVIAYSKSIGVNLTEGSFVNNRIRGNSIHDSGQLGLDFDPPGPDFNDPLDADEGGNRGQNFPIIQTVTIEAPQAGTHIVGKLHSTPATTFDLDFYANAACLPFPREYLEGQTYLESSQVTTDGSGNAAIDVTLAATIQPGQQISATATDPAGNTSEFSQRIAFSVDPPSGFFGTPVTISGTDFADGTAVTVDGTPATGVSLTDDHTLQATIPTFPAGTSHDVAVTTPDGTTGTVVKGWVTDFFDVAAGNLFHSVVTTLVSNGITAGVGNGNFDTESPTLRQQMAVFLLKSKHGICYVPPPCTTATFTDVPCSYPNFAPWIYALVAEGITSGCGTGTTFCPTDPVNRQQMAAFLIKAVEAPGYTPPPCDHQNFDDVPCDPAHPFPSWWINELNNRGITNGCGGLSYCPLDFAKRGQMAVFLVKTFGLQ
jgi:hypothetical protein